MWVLLGFSRGVDWMNERFGRVADWCILVACGISATNAVLRYGLNFSNNAWLEVQWYLFAGMVMLGASYTLQRNQHVRVDIFYSLLGMRTKVWVDIFGLVFFMMPAILMLAWMTWPYFLDSYVRHEISATPGGLLRWPVKLLMPLGFFLLALQGFSEIIKRVALLRGDIRPGDVIVGYERPEQ